MKDFNTGNYKTLLKEIKDTNKWKTILCSWIRKLNIFKMSMFHKVIYKSFSTRVPCIQKGQSFQQLVLGKLDIHM